MAFGPLVGVKTLTAAVTLDVNRSLNFPVGVVLALVRPDDSEATNWATIATLVRGFNRIGVEERPRGEGYNVRFRIADTYPEGQLVGWLNGDDRATHILFQGVYHKITDVPKVPPDVAQVYDITCHTRNLVRASA